VSALVVTYICAVNLRALRASSAEKWLLHLDFMNSQVMQPYPQTKNDRVKIAVLDTGVYMEDHFIALNRKRIEYDTFIPGDQAGPEDLDGHGTHCTGILLKVAKNAQIYVARIAKDDGLEYPEQIAQVSWPAIIIVLNTENDN
jgi:subtilisin family serine protease